MEYHRISKHLEISKYGFGCEQLGQYEWGDYDQKELERAVDIAVEMGISFFDTADVYGLGNSEINLAKFLKGNLNKVVIASKFGVRFSKGRKFYDNSREWLLESIHNSLSRLKRDYIDLYQVHYWDNVTPLEKIVENFENLVEKGKIRSYGFSNIVPNLELINDSAPNFVSCSFKYNLVNRENLESLKFCNSNGLSCISWGSLGEGILTGKYDINHKFNSNDRRSRKEYSNFHGEKFLKNLKVVKKLKEIAGKYNKTPSQIAIRWLLDSGNVDCVLLGTKSEKHVLDNSLAFNWKLEKKDLSTLNNINTNC